MGGSVARWASFFDHSQQSLLREQSIKESFNHFSLTLALQAWSCPLHWQMDGKTVAILPSKYFNKNGRSKKLAVNNIHGIHLRASQSAPGTHRASFSLFMISTLAFGVDSTTLLACPKLQLLRMGEWAGGWYPLPTYLTPCLPPSLPPSLPPLGYGSWRQRPNFFGIFPCVG